ncbi:MAG TPA: hypothetical protein ENK74_05270 [Nitratifractor sp.]|nr:hypothetical protein [Nitratifractor sp.]
MKDLPEVENFNDYDSPRESFFKPYHIVVAIFLLFYLYSLFFGSYSVGVLVDVKKRLSTLQEEYNSLQNENQKLQKKHFELIQLTPQEDAF